MSDDSLRLISGLGSLSYEQARLEKGARELEHARSVSKGVGRATDPARHEERQQEIRQAATQFEALLLQQMLKSRWATVPSEGVLGGSREEEYYRDMLSEGIAESIAEQSSIGIRDVLIKDLNRLDKN